MFSAYSIYLIHDREHLHMKFFQIILFLFFGCPYHNVSIFFSTTIYAFRSRLVILLNMITNVIGS